MARPQHYFDWQRIVDDHADDVPATSSQRRLRVILALFAVASAIIFARAMQLEISDGENFRQLAAEPLERTVVVPAARGRIMARDGTELAVDRTAKALAIHYRYLEDPPDAAWLDRMVRSRLPRADRKRPGRMAAMRTTVRAEIAASQERLARLCGWSQGEWQAKVDRIQGRVRTVAASVERQRIDRFEARREQDRLTDTSSELSLGVILTGLFAPPEPLAPKNVTLAEQVAWHRVVDDLSPEVAAQIEQNLAAFPGAKIVEYTRSTYPSGSLAAHLLGHVSSTSGVHFQSQRDATTQDEAEGRMGAELRFDRTLQGRAGFEVQHVDRKGKLLSVSNRQDAAPGQEIVLTIDPRLQTAAEQLLDHVVRRLDREAASGATMHRAVAGHGGAAVAMDVRSGEVLLAASCPRFDPNQFAAGDPGVEAVLTDPREPLFDRVTKMAIPPGSVFKPLVAFALLENGVVDAEKKFNCQGYWDEPDRLRCQIFRQHGIGHGEVTLADALARSCNVYFFHHADQLGAETLLDWARRFGFAESTGINLPDEAAGQLPTLSRLRHVRELQAFSIGQSELTATPLAIARMYAAIANGGHLITPVITRDRIDASGEALGSHPADQLTDATRITGLGAHSLAVVREGLVRAVNDPAGTAFDAMRLSGVTVAGKTGTAQTGDEKLDHAWFAGYVPAEAPRYVLVVAIEHGGSGASVAGTVVKGLVQTMQQLGYVGVQETAEKKIPPGKG